jgi:predicted nucleotidyltransferase
MGRTTTKEVIKELKRLKKLAESKYTLDKMYLFGSRARGEELLSSDADVIVVSKDFKRIPFKKRPDFFLDNWDLPVDLEIIGYTPEELIRKKKEWGIVRQAMKEGVQV